MPKLVYSVERGTNYSAAGQQDSTVAISRRQWKPECVTMLRHT